jgi:hypothetical protein
MDTTAVQPPRTLTTPVALLVGVPIAGLFLAAAVFFGLRSRAPSASGVAIELRPGAGAARAAISPSSAQATASVPAPAALAARASPVALAAANALAEQHDAVVSKCWMPNAGGPANLKQVRYQFHVELDADGKQARGSHMVAAGPTRPAIDECLGATLRPLRVPATGAASAVDLVLTLP